MWHVLVAVAAAQEGQEASGGETPLAIPADTPSPDARPPERAEPSDRPLAIPGRREPSADAAAIREYRSRYLSLRNLSEAYVGTTWSYGYYGGYGWPGPWGWAAWPHAFVVRRDEQAVFQGPSRLDMPETFGALGDPIGKERLEHRIRKNRTVAGVLYGVGVAGVAASVAGLVGMDQARTYDDLTTWSAVSWGGVGLMVGGLVGGSFPTARAWRLQLEPDATIEPTELQDRIQEHNARLAEELGLDPLEAVRLEGAPVR